MPPICRSWPKPSSPHVSFRRGSTGVPANEPTSWVTGPPDVRNNTTYLRLGPDLQGVTLVITGRHKARVAALFPDRARTIAGADQSRILQGRAGIIREVNVEQEPTYGAYTGASEESSAHLSLIFRWPPVLAWRRDATVGGVQAMLKFVPL